LATAQCITVKKGLLNGTNKGVLAKLAVDNWYKYSDVQKRLEQIPEDWKNIDMVFRNFLGLTVALNKATSYKYMGEAAYADE
jgi:hypothetical protein